MKKYEIIDHTADIGLRCWGGDLKELFANAAYGMFEIMADLQDVQPKESVKIELKAPNLEELFLSWRSELLYQYNSKEIVFKQPLIKKISENLINAQVQGEKLDLQRHKLKTEIKAVTYHKLSVQKLKQNWQGEVIFDV